MPKFKDREKKDIFKAILSSQFDYRKYTNGKTGFLNTALFFTALLGFPILYAEKTIIPSLNGSSIFLLMGIGLILTSLLLFFAKKVEVRRSENVDWERWHSYRLLQVLFTLPGVLHAGTTSTALIWRSFDSETLSSVACYSCYKFAMALYPDSNHSSNDKYLLPVTQSSLISIIIQPATLRSD